MPRPTLLTEKILKECDRRASKGRGDRSGEKIAVLAEEFGVTEGTLKVKLAEFRRSKLTSPARMEKSKLTSPPPAPKPRKSPPAPNSREVLAEKGGRREPVAPELDVRPEVRKIQGWMPSVDHAIGDLMARVAELETRGPAPVEVNIPDAVAIVRAMFDYLGPQDAWKELGEIDRQTVYGWYDRDRIPGWVHDIGWD